MGAIPIPASKKIDYCPGVVMVAKTDLKSVGRNPVWVRVPPRAQIMKKISINENFFSSWSSDMSYVLGFVTADGCVGVRRIRKRDNEKVYYFNITSKDIEILEKIKNSMEGQQKIYCKSNGYSKEKIYHFIQVNNQKICKDLINLGIQPRKTYNLEPIKVPDKYFADFVRGVFDGDGTVYIYNVNSTPQIKAGFVSTRLSFLAEFNKQLCENLGISTKSIHRTIDKRGKEKMVQFNIHFYIDDCERLYKFMYKNASIFLDRKYRIFKDWENIKSKNRRHYIKQDYPSKIGWQLNRKVLV